MKFNDGRFIHMNKRLLIGLLVTLMGGLSQVEAMDFRGRLGIGGSYGPAYPTLPDEFKDDTDRGEIWSGNVKVGIADDTMLVASYSNILVEDKTSKRDLLLRPIVLSLRYYAFHNSPINPYITAGAGYSRNRRELPLPAEDQVFRKFAAQGGVGIEFFITPTASIGVEGLYHHLVATADESPLRLFTAAGTANFYFGAPESTKEAKREVKKTQEELDQAKAEQDRLRESEAASAAAAASAQQNAEQARLDAERRAQEAQSQTQAAQAELQNIQEMISKKEIDPIKFATGSDKLLVESYPSLDQVSQVVAKYPALKLRVEGHTDSVGDDTANLRLSQKRADAVRQYLVTKGNVQADQVEAVGLGETKPVTTNDTAEGRAQNRRVEFLFVQ